MSDQYKLTMKRIGVLESIEVIQPDDDAGIQRHKEEVEMIAMKRAGKNANNAQNGPDNDHAEQSVNTSRTTLPKTTILIPSKDRAPWYDQARHLFARNWMSYWRNQTFIYSRHFIQLLLSIIFGLIYLDLQATDVSSATSLIGAIFMGVVFSAIGVMQTLIATSFETRPTFYREKASGYYQATWWAVVQLCIEIVFTIPSIIVTVLPTYFMIGLKREADVFFSYIFFTWLLFLIYISTGMMLASLAPNSGAAGVLAGAFLSFANALSGVSITSPAIPRGWHWVYEALPIQHVLQGLIVPQFRGNDSLMTSVVDGAEVQVTVEEFALSYLGWKADQQLARQIIWIALYLCLSLGVCVLATNFVAHNKR